MNILFTIVVVVIIFSILVLIHELGHFLAAKRAGVRVLEFGVGFPPRLYSKKHGETIYSINAIPFGGFVKLFGEDPREPEAMKSEKSFATKTPWVRTKIIVAGVLMNFFLAYVLLTAGFTFGIQPLILNEQDLFTHLQSGVVQARPGIFIKKPKKGSEAERAGIKDNDELLSINGKPVLSRKAAEALQAKNIIQDFDLGILRNGKPLEIHLVRPEAGKKLGLELATMVSLPRPVIASVSTKEKIFQKGDIVLRIDGREVYNPTEVLDLLSYGNRDEITLFRGRETVKIPFIVEGRHSIYFSEVSASSEAEKAGFQSGDLLLRINGKEPSGPKEAQKIIRAAAGKPLEYEVERGGKKQKITAKTNAKNILGVVFSPTFFFHNAELELYQSNVLTSLVKIDEVSYPFFQAASQAWYEVKRLTSVTIGAFGRTFKQIFTKFEVPEDIGGPVQIAYYTHVFVQEGFFAILRFVALLSLSLAVINIIPFPALDGGRFLFIVIEVITGKRVNTRFEALIHSLGFGVLLLLIILVTYSDFAKIFS